MRGATGISSAHRRLTRFQSTPLMRGATRWARPTSTSPACFNPRPSCEGRLDPKAGEYARLRVSIHAPHARGDDELLDVVVRDVVSIHAPHARGDSTLMVPSSLTLSFNPRPSCEGRPRTLRCRRGRYSFQSTPLMRGATCVARADRGPRVVSIHAPHARGDPCATPTCPGRARFNPRPSCEGRPKTAYALDEALAFQSTPLMRGATCAPPRICKEGIVSIHAPHARGDKYDGDKTYTGEGFNPRPSCEGRLDDLLRQATDYMFQSTPLMRGATARCCETLNITYPI